MTAYKFTGTNVGFDAAEFGQVIAKALADKYGIACDVEIDTVIPGSYSDDFSIQVIPDENRLVAAIVERDQEGFWTHPGYFEPAGGGEYGAPGEFEDWLELYGLECASLAMSEDDGIPDQDVVDWDYGHWDASNWNPTAPAGEGWFIGSIHDTEDGPFCVWLRAKAGEHV